MTRWQVELFVDGKSQGRVAGRTFETRIEAEKVAERWSFAHGHKHDYRAMPAPDNETD